MSFNLIFVTIIIVFFFKEIQTEEKNITYMNNEIVDPYLNIQNTSNTKDIRKLQSPTPINIFVDTTILERNLEDDDKEKNAIKAAIKKAQETLQKIIKIKTKTNPINILKYLNKFSSNYQTLLTKNYQSQPDIDCDVLIFIRGVSSTANFDKLSKISKYEIDPSTRRVLVGCIEYNVRYKLNSESTIAVNYTHREYLLTTLFIHEFIHFLGFDNEILSYYNLIRNQQLTKNRVKTGHYIEKYVVVNKNVINLAKEYYGCFEEEYIPYIEFAKQNEQEDLPNSHWEGRLLLGDIMTFDLYYPEQVISEFTLKLLEQLGWYEINYFTGGLMKYGKGRGCSFLKDDCIEYLNNPVGNKVRFPNEFCEQSFGSCSFGRQSRSFCYNKGTLKTTSDISDYQRNEYIYTLGYGLTIDEYCPVSKETSLDTENYYYYGSCSIGNNEYGESLVFLDEKIDHKYKDFGDAFLEKIGDKSFCALSSVLQKNDNDIKYKGLIRPTCYEMLCSEKSLTIRIGSEYIVCPRFGGLVKLEGEYTDYKGYLFCPDYNLICIGTEMCNNLFDCIDKEIQSKEKEYNSDYYSKKINYTSEVKTNNESEIKQYYSTSEEGYEQSEDGQCPLNCMQCLSGNRCILCGNSNNVYIGEKDDDSSHINCTKNEPQEGYYNITKRGHNHYFRCVSGCAHCKNNNSCSQCFPEFYLSDDNKTCNERIPHCKTYDNSSQSIFKDPKNNNADGYKYCLECDNENNYFCIDGNRTRCDPIGNRKYYYNLDNNKYPCIRSCKDEYDNCEGCDGTKCFYCFPEFFFNNKVCTERIPNCLIYDQNSSKPDILTNNGHDGYTECKTCEEKHYCIKQNKSICQYIESVENGYYTNSFGCQEKCEDKFTFVCLKCEEEKCTLCQTRNKSDGTCVKGILNCIEYDQKSGNDTYIECLHCDEENGFYCIDNNRDTCENVNINLYYDLDPFNGSTCYRKCDKNYPGCEVCNKTICTECKKKYEMDSPSNISCSLQYEPQNPDNCRVITQEINDDIQNINFTKLTEYYREKIYFYINPVIHYVNKNYTMALFVNPDCTESLLEQGYYKIDSKVLNKKMVDVVGTERINHGFLLNFFIQYNNLNHYRMYDFNDQYLDPKTDCQECLKVPFILTNKYNNTISVALGSIIASAITLDKLDIFSKDSEVFTDLCQNVTLEGVDIPLSERLHYLYMEDYSTQMACGGNNCQLLEVNKEESTSVCRCELNEYDDLLKEDVNKIEKPEQPELKSSPSDSFGIIKCTKNGFHANNVKSNGGFYICLIVIVGVGVLILCYFLCSKIITTSEKGMNPPSKVKNRLRIISNWDKTEEERKKMKKFNEEVMNDFQPRDGHEDELTEEEKDYSYIYYDMSNSFDTALFEKKFNNNRGRSDKTRKILVLLPGTKKDKNEEDNFSSSESSPLGDSSRKKKKTFCQIYWHVLSLKQHIINFFSFCSCLNITESYIPLPIRIIRSLFLVVVSFLLSILFLNQKYYSKKFKYFNEKYKLIAGTTYGVTITPEEVKGGVPSGELWKYSFTHTFVNGIIVFVLLLVVQFLIGVAFFSLRNKVIEVLKKNDTSGINELVSQTRIKYIVFFIIVGALLFIFLFVFIAFGGAYGGGFSDYFLPGIVALIFLQIFPFLWSLVISLLYYLGIKQKSKCCRQTSRFFMF